VLVHAGDITQHGAIDELWGLNSFFAALPHRHKLVIAGNHDWCFERSAGRCRRLLRDATYLQDEGIEIGGLHFYGSPWTPWFYSWAFNLHRGQEIRAKWLQIPHTTDVLITHGPPLGIGDRTQEGEQTGCMDLLEIIESVAPRVHIFGHIHEGAGVYQKDGTTFVNASSVDRSYRLAHEPVVIDLG
jgi:Icc-related predicted phosphoesterase